MFLEAYEKIMKNFFEAISKKKEVVVQSDLNEFCENQDKQGEPIQLPCGE